MAGGVQHVEGDAVQALVARVAAAESRIAELERPTGTQNAQVVKNLQLAVEELQETVAYLESLRVVSAVSASSTISIGNDTWTSDGDLRPSLTIRTSTGKLRVTVGGFVSYSLITFSIPGYVDRDAQISGSTWLHQLYSASSGMGASKTLLVTGLPLDTDLTVQAEVRGLAAGSPLAGHVSVIAEVVP